MLRPVPCDQPLIISHLEVSQVPEGICEATPENTTTPNRDIRSLSKDSFLHDQRIFEQKTRSLKKWIKMKRWRSVNSVEKNHLSKKFPLGFKKEVFERILKDRT